MDFDYKPTYITDYTDYISKDKVRASDWNALFKSLITGHNKHATDIQALVKHINARVVDSELSTESENPVQNKVITEKIKVIVEALQRTVMLNLENGEGVGSIKAIYDTENGPVGSSGTTNEDYEPEANGKNAVALTARAKANGDCSIAGGWSAEAHTKGDVALSAGQAGMTETEFKKEYPNGYPYRTKTLAENITVPEDKKYFYSTNNPSTNDHVIHYLTYAGFKALIQNSAFAACSGKALGVKSSAIGEGTIAHKGQAVTGKFTKETVETYEDGDLSTKDAIAIISNGTAKENRSNGIEVYRNHVKSKIKPTHPDDIARLQELNSIARKRVVGSFGTKKVDENGNVIYDNTRTQIIRSDVSVLNEIDENDNPILDENNKPIGGRFYAKEINAVTIKINGKPISSGSGGNGGTKIYKHTLTGHIKNTGAGLYFAVVFYSLSENDNYEIVADSITCDLLIYTDSTFLSGPFISTDTVTNPEPYENISSDAAATVCEIHFSKDYWWQGEYVSHTIEHEVVGV